MRPDDIHHFIRCSDPQVSPDGTTVAYVVTRVDEERNTYRSRVWTADVDGRHPPRPVSAGEHDDASPRWSPDGRLLLFTTTRRTDKGRRTRSALYALATDGPGEAALLAEHDEPITGPAVSPDSRRVVYSCRARGEHYEADDVDRRPPRRIDRPFYRTDGVGTVFDRPRHLFLLALDSGGAPVDLTPGDAEFSDPAWYPDSRRLLATRVDTAERMFSSDIARVDLDTHAVETLTDGTGVYGNPAVGPDGTVAVTGYHDADVFPQNTALGLLGERDTRPTWITGELDRDWNGFPAGIAPVWDATGTGMYGIVADRGSVHVHRVGLDGTLTPVVTGERWVSAAHAAGGTLAVAVESRDRPAEIHVVVDGHERRLTSVTDGFVRQIAPVAGERFTAPTADGHEVDAWVFVPHDLDLAEQHPMLLNIHGGPFTQFGDFFFDEAQHQARGGFVVVYANPRGGSGRDTDWGRAIRGPVLGGPGWGTVDADDLHAVVDTALERFGFIDPDRVGVLGGSYGGYMTSWLIGHTDRFAAACSERAVNNLVTLDLTSDIAGVGRFWFGVGAGDDPDELMRMSPISAVDDITTPVLIIHSDDDLRCPFEQADQLYFALRERGREVEYYRFPGECHELSRSGSPVHRIQRAELILDWFHRRLGSSNG